MKKGLGPIWKVSTKVYAAVHAKSTIVVFTDLTLIQLTRQCMETLTLLPPPHVGRTTDPSFVAFLLSFGLSSRITLVINLPSFTLG